MLDLRCIDTIKPNPRNARKHPKKQVRRLADAIVAFGFYNPIHVDENGVIIVGHGRYEAAKLLGLKQVPVNVLHGLSESKCRALAIADNKIAEGSIWDRKTLAVELPEVAELLVKDGLEISITGFVLMEFEAPHDAPDRRTRRAPSFINREARVCSYCGRILVNADENTDAVHATQEV